ncbi:MAG TPA: bi-domain-containing oxidoreductase [Anaerolineales bacterium]|nr:bi-domain-containing oxidoreductase [Anaerolineales bacterium]
MKQLLQYLRNGKTAVEDVPVPVPPPGMALVRTQASLVSAGTERMVVDFARQSLLGKARRRPDLVRQVIQKARREGLRSAAHAAFNRLDQPMALGYSSAGSIVGLGAEMPGFKVGQRVACAGSGYAVHAEYAVVPRNLLTLLPDNVDYESAAFVTLGAIGLHGFRLARPQVGERVAVVGLGLLGLLTAQIASAAGCQVLGIDVDAARVRLGTSLGVVSITRARAEDAFQAFTRGRGFDVVLICADTASNDPVELAGEIARDRGRVVAIGAVGQHIPRRPYYEKELAFMNSRSYGPGRYDSSYEEQGNDYPIGQVRWTEGRNLEAVVELMATSKLKVQPLITHRFPIQQATRAYELITGKAHQAFLGVLLTYDVRPSARVSKVEFPRPSSKGAAVHLGVFGAGNFASATLLPAVKRVGGIDLVGIASPGGLHAAHLAHKFGFAFAASSLDDVLKDDRINTVAILTRHDSHAELAVRSMKSGRNVFVEKPLAITTEQLAAVERQLRRKNDGILMVGFNRRFAPLARALSEYFVGRLESLHAHYRINAGFLPLNHWAQEPAQGGRILGEACHFVDLITFLVGSPPIAVDAHALPDAGKYREDNVSMTFSFADGSVGVVDYLSNGDTSLPKERLEVFSSGKTAILDDFRSLELRHGGTRRLIQQDQDKGWANEWRSLSEAIREGGAPPIPYDQLLGVTRAMLAAVQSVRTRQSVSI